MAGLVPAIHVLLSDARLRRGCPGHLARRRASRFCPGMTTREPVVTFDDVRKITIAWPEVEDGTSYGTPALKVRKKLLARLKEDGDSLVMPGVPLDEREMLIETQPKIFY